MSKAGLMFDVGHAEQPGRLLKEVTLLVRVLRAAHEADRVGAIDRHLGGSALARDEPWGALDPITRRTIDNEVRRIHLLSRDPVLVARLANFLRDLRDGLVPRDVFPVV